jgi:zona occludens toxin (predicted ATPase)
MHIDHDLLLPTTAVNQLGQPPPTFLLSYYCWHSAVQPIDCIPNPATTPPQTAVTASVSWQPSAASPTAAGS